MIVRGMCLSGMPASLSASSVNTGVPWEYVWVRCEGRLILRNSRRTLIKS